MEWGVEWWIHSFSIQKGVEEWISLLFSKGVGVGFHSKIKGVTNTLAKNQIKVHTYVGAVRVTIHFVFHEIAM